MAKIELPPTKSSLRKIKQELEFAYEGHDLLNQKREILAFEIVRKIAKIREIESRFLEVLHNLYDAYRNAALDMGSQVIALKSCAEKKPYTLNIQFNRFMGLNLPKIGFEINLWQPPDNLTGTTAAYDAAKWESKQALQALSEYASITKQIIMLSRELKKVQRRVNSLEKVFIPPHEEAKKYITDRIEEMEREEVFVKKLVRQRIEKGKGVPL